MRVRVRVREDRLGRRDGVECERGCKVVGRRAAQRLEGDAARRVGHAAKVRRELLQRRAHRLRVDQVGDAVLEPTELRGLGQG